MEPDSVLVECLWKMQLRWFSLLRQYETMVYDADNKYPISGTVYVIEQCTI